MPVKFTDVSYFIRKLGGHYHHRGVLVILLVRIKVVEVAHVGIGPEGLLVDVLK